MRTIFVSEFLCSGACADQDLPDSLLCEGQLMWLALLEDLSQHSALTIHTTCDARLQIPELPRLVVHAIDSPKLEIERFKELVQTTDATLVIAPELDRILEQRIAILNHFQRGQLMSSPATVTVTADKWQFYEFSQTHHLPTPRSLLLATRLPEISSVGYPCLIKPCFGAGTTATFRVNDQADWDRLRESNPAAVLFPSLLQPWVTGQPVSVSCLIDPVSGEKLWLPAGEQTFEDLHYRGGRMPLHQEENVRIRHLAEQIIDSLPGLRGYIGIDLLLCPEAEQPVQVLEVNPRLSTSYIGSRQLADFPLAPWFLGTEKKPVPHWKTGSLSFDLCGNLTWSR